MAAGNRDDGGQARLGERLPGGLRLEELVGRGGSATVYRARREDGLVGAAKIMHSELTLDATWRLRFQREISLLRRATHPALTRVLDVSSSEHPCFFVMELLEGQSLERRRTMAGGSLPVDVVMRWADGVLDALASVHAHGIVHRDIKPSNVFITNNGSLKLLDFGIAHVEARTPGGTLRETIARGVLGTPAYMPPEQARGRWDLVDARTDLWSVAAMLFMLLAGEPVHVAETENERLGLAMSIPARSLRAALPGVSPAIARVIDRALAYEAGNRWATAEDFRRALTGAWNSDKIEGWSTHTTQRHPAPSRLARARRRRWAPALALVAACALTLHAQTRAAPTPSATSARGLSPQSASASTPDWNAELPPLPPAASERASKPAPVPPPPRASDRVRLPHVTRTSKRRAAPAWSARTGVERADILDVRVIGGRIDVSDALLDRRE